MQYSSVVEHSTPDREEEISCEDTEKSVNTVMSIFENIWGLKLKVIIPERRYIKEKIKIAKQNLETKKENEEWKRKIWLK